jgi:hypothetical protein
MLSYQVADAVAEPALVTVQDTSTVSFRVACNGTVAEVV